MKTTILLPLHRSHRWKSALIDQVRELQQVAELVISDATENDDTLAELRDEFGDAPRITWLGRRPLADGWRAHANDLIGHVSTPYLMWHSHDDHIGVDWITAAEAVLEEKRDVVAACGPVRSFDDVEPARRLVLDVPSFVELSDSRERIAAALAALLSRRPADLGVLYRSVVRTSAVRPLPPGITDDQYSDVLWALSLVERGPIGRMDAWYTKRWHADSAHSQWTTWDARSPALREILIKQLSTADLQTVVDAWTVDASLFNAAIESVRLEERASAAAALASLRDDFERSRSWRITAPFRRRATGRRPSS